MANLGTLLNPHSVAIVGASETSWYGQLVLKNLQACKFTGPIFPVNPKYDRVLGLKCYPSLSSIPEKVDCVVMTIGKRYTLDVLREAAKIGVTAAILFASGFAEGGDPEGQELEERLKDLANTNGINICGPNCLGLYNVHSGVAMWGGPNPHLITAGAIGVVMQSGSFAITFANSMVEKGVGLSYLISNGNSVNVDVADLMEFMVDDSETQIIVGYVEGFKNVAKLLHVADRAAAQNKPIVLLKIGRSKGAAKSAVAHTGALVGTDPVYEAVFRQKGVIRVFDFDELAETVALLSVHRSFANEKVAAISISGGEAGVMADLGEATFGLEFPDFSPETRARLAQHLPPYIAIGNPLDSAGARMLEDGSTASYAQCLQTLAEDPELGLIIIPHDARERSFAAGRTENGLFRDVAVAVAGVARQTEKPFICISPVSGQMDEYGTRTLQMAGVPLLQGLRPGLQAIANVIHYGRFQGRQETHGFPSVTTKMGVSQIRARLVTAQHRLLPEHLSATILSEYGIPVAKSRIATDVELVLNSASDIGFPLVMKVISPQIAHRSDIGAIKVGVRDAKATTRAYHEIVANTRQAMPDAEIEGVLIQEMVPEGVEIIVGLTHDPQFGAVLMCGLGGVFVEVLNDIVLRVPPISRQEALAMIKELKGYPVLAGTRGGPRRDVAALSDVLVRVAALACDLGDLIDELDINPVMVFAEGKGVKAVDALIVLRRENDVLND